MQDVQPMYDTISKKIHKEVENISNKVSTKYKGILGIDESIISYNIDKGLDYVEKISKDVNEGINQIINVFNILLPNILKDVDIKNKNWEEVSSQIVHNIDDRVRFLSNVIKDPEIRKALQRIIKVYGKVIKEVYHLDEPLIQAITDDIWKTINIVSEKSARNISNAMIQSGMAAVAEIPGLGGAIDLVVAFGKWYNTAAGILAPTILQLQDTTHKTIQMGKDGMAVAHKYDKDIRTVQKELNNAVEQFHSKTANINTFKPNDPDPSIEPTDISSQKGGKRTKLRKKSKKTVKRLVKSISTFTRYKHN